MIVSIELSERDVDRAKTLAEWRGARKLEDFLVGAIQSEMAKQEKVRAKAIADQWRQSSC